MATTDGGDLSVVWIATCVLPDENLPHFIIDSENPKTKLEIRWKTEPDTLPRGSVTYEVRVVAGEEVLTSRQIEHGGQSEQKVIFTHEDF